MSTPPASSEPPRTQKTWSRQIGFWFRRSWRGILVINDTPHRVGLGVAIGFFIGWLPIMGIQMILSAVATKLARANMLASFPPVWISNAVTFLPMYWLCYRVGAVFTGGSHTFHQMKVRMGEVKAVLDESFWAGFLEFFDAFAGDYLWPMFIGGAILGVATAVPFYVLTRSAVERYQARRNRRRQRWMAGDEPVSSVIVDPRKGA